MKKVRIAPAAGTLPPEGPYEIDGTLEPQRVRDEQVRFAEFVGRFHSEAESILKLGAGQREMRMVLHLVTSHFDGNLVTTSSLAAASGMSYGTALRAIDAMTRRGMIVRRERTASGRSHSLHPSSSLLQRWREFAFRGEKLMKSALRDEPPARAQRSRSGDALLPPPAVLTSKLQLGKGLRVLVHSDPTFMAMLNLKRQFEMILGTSIESRAHSIDRLREELIRNSERAVSMYDIVAVDLPWIGEMAEEGRLLPLDRLLEDSDFDQSDIYSDALASSRWKGRQYGVPIMVSGELLVYRTDLLEEAGLAPPRTTDELLEVARALHQPAAGRAGIAWNGGRGTALGHTVLMLMAAFGQSVLDLPRTEEGFDYAAVEGALLRPMFDSEAAARTAEFLLSLREVAPPDVLRMTWYDRAKAYAEGRTAMAYSHSLLAPVYELDRSSPAYRKTGYAAHPTSAGSRPIVPMGGYSLAIPSNIAARRVDAVWQALQAMTTASAAKIYMTNGSLASPRRSVSLDPEVAALSPMIATVDEMEARGYLKMWPRAPLPGIAEVIAIAGEEFHDMLLGKQSRAEATRAAQRRAVDALAKVRRQD
ncbi:extracellular solute-binding protein [Rhodobacteraceae bacterium 2CG4]|uniref:Extracellular solute-binding protein n=1 Tax=Halovulum marinum TaxID=2662447 RepID=A0A6L5Z638_9RHOB|nr:extracellular solute-binding protein [Halovulum marinum]MSU92051.1 extracellular solute-binding protein [Halovulum marinum]